MRSTSVTFDESRRQRPFITATRHGYETRHRNEYIAIKDFTGVIYARNTFVSPWIFEVLIYCLIGLENWKCLNSWHKSLLITLFMEVEIHFSTCACHITSAELSTTMLATRWAWCYLFGRFFSPSNLNSGGWGGEQRGVISNHVSDISTINPLTVTPPKAFPHSSPTPHPLYYAYLGHACQC